MSGAGEFWATVVGAVGGASLLGWCLVVWISNRRLKRESRVEVERAWEKWRTKEQANKQTEGK